MSQGVIKLTLQSLTTVIDSVAILCYCSVLHLHGEVLYRFCVYKQCIHVTTRTLSIVKSEHRMQVLL